MRSLRESESLVDVVVGGSTVSTGSVVGAGVGVGAGVAVGVGVGVGAGSVDAVGVGSGDAVGVGSPVRPMRSVLGWARWPRRVRVRWTGPRGR